MGWEKLKQNINETATEALGTRKTNQGKAGPNKTPWFCSQGAMQKEKDSLLTIKNSAVSGRLPRIQENKKCYQHTCKTS